MDLSIAILLAQDGIAQGTIYMLLAVALVLVFSVTRIIFVPQGDFVTYGALTLASIQLGAVPGTVWILLAFSVCTVATDFVRRLFSAERKVHLGKSIFLILYAAFLVVICSQIELKSLNLIIQVILTIAIVAPMGPCVYRLAFLPLAQSSELVLLIAAVALHFVMVGAGLLAFGPEGFRTNEIVGGSFEIAGVVVSLQSVAILAFGCVLIVSLYSLVTKTMPGKALMATAVNRTGARIVGIDLERSGAACFSVAAAIGAISGILVSSVTTIYYDSGFLIVLKGFVAAIFGGLSNYLLTAVGAIALGIIESFASFWTSAFKDAVLFSLIIPILLFRSLLIRGPSGDRP